MSDAAERPAAEHDADAWAAACEEDLAAERRRRRAEYGRQPVSATEELRRLADAVTAKVAELGAPFGGTAGQLAAQGMAQQLIAQAKAAVEPVVERNPHVFGHLAAAGSELLAAYRSAVQDQERRWTGDPRPHTPRGRDGGHPRDGEDGTGGPSATPSAEGASGGAGDVPPGGRGPRPDDDPGAGPERIDLD